MNSVGVAVRTDRGPWASNQLTVAPPAELGGRSGEGATVSWLDAQGPRSVRTATPTEFILNLRAEFGGAEVPALTVTRPTLEDAYLALIGEMDA